MNKTFIIGNLTRDPEKKTTKDGVNYTVFTVAVNRKKHADGAQDVDYFRVTAWRGLGDTCAQYLAKGRKVSVVGTVAASAYQDQTGSPRASLEVNAEDVEFLTPKGAGDPAQPEET